MQWTELQSGVTWHGHIDDLARLVYCLAAHCTCGRPTQAGDGIWQCGAHRMVTQQHTMDHLAFARGMRQQYIDAEWVVYWEPDEPVEQRGIGRLDLLRRQPQRLSAQLRGARTLVCGLLAVLLLFSVGGLQRPSSSGTSQVAAWQTR